MELVITHLPFIVVYRVSDQTVEILRVFHTSQDWPEHIQ
jgi:toxin ParE1/3/4